MPWKLTGWTVRSLTVMSDRCTRMPMVPMGGRTIVAPAPVPVPALPGTPSLGPNTPLAHLERMLPASPRLTVPKALDEDTAGSLAEATPALGTAQMTPVLPPLAMADMIAGLYGAMATVVAVRDIERNGGAGQVIDLSLLDAIFSILGPEPAIHRLTGKIRKRVGSASESTSPRNVYATKDGGWVAISASTQAMTERLFRTIGRGDLNDDPAFRTNAERIKRRAEVDAIVGGWIGERTLWFSGVRLRSRMTVLRMADGRLSVHSASEPTSELCAELDRLGDDLVDELDDRLVVGGLAQVDEHQVHIGAARQDVHAVARAQQLLGDGLRAGHRALLALAEQLGARDLQRHRLARDHVLERAALLAREHGGVDLLRVLLAAEDHAAARAAEGLVDRGRDDVGVRHGVRVQARGDQAGEVGHVHHEHRPDGQVRRHEAGDAHLPGPLVQGGEVVAAQATRADDARHAGPEAALDVPTNGVGTREVDRGVEAEVLDQRARLRGVDDVAREQQDPAHAQLAQLRHPDAGVAQGH